MPTQDDSSGGRRGRGNKPKVHRRRRILSNRNAKSSAAAGGRSRGHGGATADGAFYGLANWFWTVFSLGGGTRQVENPGLVEAGEVARLSGTTMAVGSALVFGIAVAAFLVRHHKVEQDRAAQVTLPDDKDNKEKDAHEQERTLQCSTERSEDGRKVSSQTEGGSLGQSHDNDNNTDSTSLPRPRRESRRISLYDVLTGEAPIPPPGERCPAAVAGGGRVGSGASRRASIFDRIADVVFNEEQKEENPVDVVAIREELDTEFRVTFREGAMGMTLSMDPANRNAIVGKVVDHGQAYRAGVHTRDLVLSVGEHKASSYGTVLAFMNIMGRPIELQFRKGGADDDGVRSCSGGSPVLTSGAGSGGGAVKGTKYSPASEAACVVGTTIADGDSIRSSRQESLSKSSKVAKGPKVPASPISPRSPHKVKGLGQEVASSDSSFGDKMERGVVVTKYGKKGSAAQRVFFLDGVSMSVAWRDLDSRSPGHRRTPSFTNLMKGQREALALAHLVEVVAGDEPDAQRPAEKGSALLREHCDESLLSRSFALQFRERSLEMTCDSQAEMRQLVTGFRDLQRQYGP